MITQIDVRDVLSRVGAAPMGDLVTRHTGRAVRSSIESELARLSGRSVVVLDFSAVRMIDFSCADEIVAQLVQASLSKAIPTDAFFLVRGLHDHMVEEVVEEVLRKRELAMVAETSTGLRLVGSVDEEARAAFSSLVGRGQAAPEDLAVDLHWSVDVTRTVLASLAGRRLVLHDAGLYRPLTAA